MRAGGHGFIPQVHFRFCQAFYGCNEHRHVLRQTAGHYRIDGDLFHGRLPESGFQHDNHFVRRPAGSLKHRFDVAGRGRHQRKSIPPSVFQKLAVHQRTGIQKILAVIYQLLLANLKRIVRCQFASHGSAFDAFGRCSVFFRFGFRMRFADCPG